MLALTRKKGDSIMIGEDIEIVIIESSKDQVRLGIKAPRNVSIYRKEIFEQIMNENKEAILNIDVKNIKNIFDI